MSNVRSLLLLLIHLAIISAVTSIKCWDCNSANNAGCGDPFRPKAFEPKNCSHPAVNIHADTFGEPKFCRKTVQKVFGEVRVIRDCGWLEEPDDVVKKLAPGECVKRSGTFSLLSEYCNCYHDLCNHGSRLLSAPVITLLSSSIAFVTIYLISS